LLPALPALAAPLLWLGCSGEAPDPEPRQTETEAAQPAELATYPASTRTLRETGVSRWMLYYGSGGETRILGVGPDDIVKLQMSLYATETEVVVESILPSPGIRRVSPDGTVLEDTLPQRFAGAFFHADLAPEVQVPEEAAPGGRQAVDGEQYPEAKNHWSLGCATAVAATVLACATAETGVGAAACAIAIAASVAACSGGHCDQIQCNGDCVSGGHLYGVCQQDPERCVCYHKSTDTGGSSANSGGWSSGGPSWCVGCSTFEECCGYTCTYWGCC
jgi:hypothetical protein